jgi:RimJ/RimL family protein N-acetyltransferase
MAAPDLLNIEKTYCKPPSSFDILEYEGRAIGLLAIDATPNPAQPGRAYIRHYYVTDPYRESGVQNDLLAHAIPRLFASPDVTSVEAPYSMLNPYVKKAFLAHGFKIASSHKNGHYIAWEVGTALLTKEKWEKLQQAKSRPAPVSPRK